jgi:hypothetical protein
VKILGEFIVAYSEKYNKLPISLSELVGADRFIRRIPKDEWGFEYQYAFNDDGFVIWSRGSIEDHEHTISAIYSRDGKGKFMTNKRLYEDEK